MEFTVPESGIPRSRARRWLGAIFDLLPRRLRRAVLFTRVHGRPPRQRPPRTFSEKVNWRIIHDRREWISTACDKLATKRWVTERFDWINVPSTLWQGEDLSELIDLDLPERWVLKPNHTAGLVCLAEGPPDPDGIEALGKATAGWLQVEMVRRLGEIAHDRAARTFLVEPFIGSGPEPPPDYKAYVFDGRVRLWQVDLDRFGANTRRAFLDRDGEPVEAGNRYIPGGPVPVPLVLDEMNRVAEAVGEGRDFIRVDLYVTGGEVFFGELTPFPGSGLELFEPPEADRWVGDFWRVPPLDAVRGTDYGMRGRRG